MKVEYSEYKDKLIHSVITQVEQQGYTIGSCIGRLDFNKEEIDESFGILKLRSPKKVCFGLFEQRRLALFLGVLWLKNKLRGATKSKWVLEVYGRSSVNDMKNLAEILHKKFNVNIRVHLETEEVKTEYQYLEE